MKKAFKFKDEKSDKFWWINYSGKDFAVNYGKNGTVGKYEVKEFETVEECEKQALKLIAQKIKKGYIEDDKFDFNNHLYFDSEEIGLHPKTSHPLFDKYFNRENYYDCGEEESPFGNDNGSDTLFYLYEHIRKNGDKDIKNFPKKVIEKNWEMIYCSPENLLKEDLKNFISGKKVSGIENSHLLIINDQVIIATAFGQIKIMGKIDEELKKMALMSLRRWNMVMEVDGYGHSNIIDEMENDMAKFGN